MNLRSDLIKRSYLITAIVTVGMSPVFAQNGEWHREVVDPTGGGRFSSLRIDTNGNAHVSYVDDTQFLLRYSFWDHNLNKWFATTLDTSAGFCSLILDSKQRPHISYIEYGTGKLKYVHWNGTSWEKRPVEIRAKNISFYTSIGLDANENPTISYYEYWGTGDDYLLHLRNVAWNGKFWGLRTVDSTAGSGKFNSLVTDSKGNSHIAYANVRDEDAGLRYARWDGQTWKVEVLEGGRPTNLPVYSVGLALDRDDLPHIAYTDMRNLLVKYATRRNDKWQFEVVDNIVRPDYPDRNGIALDAEGNVYISYYDAGLGVLKLAYRKQNKWVSEIVDENFSGFTSSLQIHNDTIWLTYSDDTGRILKCARKLIGQLRSAR